MAFSSRSSFAQFAGPFVLAIIIGATAGLGAVLFKWLILLLQKILWPEGTSFIQQVAQAPLWQKILIPTLAALILGPAISRFGPELRGPGVPEVMEALAHRGGKIRHRVTLLKSLITATFIASGASVGREGPIVQIGSSIGSSITQFLGLGTEFKRLAVACGAASGIAAVFQAPMAGTLFAVEILLFDLEVVSLSNIVVSSVTGTVVARFLLGNQKVFEVPEFVFTSHLELILYFAMGLVTGILSLFLMGVIFGLPGIWKRLRVPEGIRPAIGGLFIGIIAIFFPWALGVGYEGINEALYGKFSLFFALTLLSIKFIATGVSIGSGMSGGVFAPSLFIGAMLGTITGFLGQTIWPDLGISPSSYALVGMGAMVSGITLAPITAILTIFEFTYRYDIIVPLMISCISSVLLVRLFHGYSVYETKLLQRGIFITRGRDASLLKGMLVRDYMNTDMEVFRDNTLLPEILDAMEISTFPHFIIVDEKDELKGVLTLRDLRTVLMHPGKCPHDLSVGSLMKKDVITIGEEDDLETAFHIFATHHFSFMPVVKRDNPRKVIGQLKKTDLMAIYEQNIMKKHLLLPRLKWICPL